MIRGRKNEVADPKKPMDNEPISPRAAPRASSTERSACVRISLASFRNTSPSEVRRTLRELRVRTRTPSLRSGSDILAERRLDDMQPAGRLAEALRLGDRPKVGQVSQFHGTLVIAPRDQSDRNILRDDHWSLRHRKRVRHNIGEVSDESPATTRRVQGDIRVRRASIQ